MNTDSSTCKIRINLLCKLDKTMQEKHLVLVRVQYVLISFLLKPWFALKKKKEKPGQSYNWTVLKNSVLDHRTNFSRDVREISPLTWYLAQFLWGKVHSESHQPLGPRFPSLPSFPAPRMHQTSPTRPRELVSQGKTQSVQSLPGLWSKTAGGTLRAVIGMKNYAHRRAESAQRGAPLWAAGPQLQTDTRHSSSVFGASVGSTACWSRVPVMPPVFPAEVAGKELQPPV